jgi:hypothetical protein
MVEYKKKKIVLQSGGTRNFYYKISFNGKKKQVSKKEYLEKKGGHKNNPNNNNWEAPPTISMNNLQKNRSQTEVPINFEEFKKKLNKLRNDERHAFQSDSHNEAKQIELIINGLKKKNPQFTLDYFRNLSAKAAEDKKATAAKTTENTARKQQREEKNRILLQGNQVPAQSSREGYSNSAPGNKVPINRMFAKRNRMGRLINSKTGLPYPNQ